MPIPSVTFRQQAISLIFLLLPSGLTAKCREPLEYMPQYKSIRVYATYNFVKVGYDSWKTFKANDQERNLFVKCYDTALALDKALNKRSTE